MRVKSNNMPRGELDKQLSDIISCLDSKYFATPNIYTDEDVKKFDLLNRLYLEILLQKDSNIIDRHRKNLNQFETDFNVLKEEANINNYIKLQK